MLSGPCITAVPLALTVSTRRNHWLQCGGSLAEPCSKPLRRVAPEGCSTFGTSARALLDARQGESATPLEVSIQALAEGRDLASEVRAGVRQAAGCVRRRRREVPGRRAHAAGT